MKLLLYFLALLNYAAIIAEGIICLNCVGRNAAECHQSGKLEECGLGEVCSTTARRSGVINYVTKRCKQRESCLNEQKQNWMRVNLLSYKCNTNRLQSICRCCCFEDRCNVNERCAAAAVAPERQNDVRCPALTEPFRRGTRRCSRGDRVGSMCRFRCSSGYQVNPGFSDPLTCLPNGKWDKPVPCCSLPCPPNLYIDFVVLVRYHDHNALLSAARKQLADFLEIVSLGPSGLLFARPHYDSVVHTPYLGFRETSFLTPEELLNLTIIENANANINSSVTNTGAAMWHVHNNLFNTEYDRPNARNVLAVVTEFPSDDDVIDSARALRESGASVYPYFFKTGFGVEPSDEEFLEISGFDNRIWKIVTPDKTAAHEGLFANFCPDACRIP